MPPTMNVFRNASAPLRVAVLTCAICLAAACSTTRNTALELGSETTYDGLVEVTNPVATRVWVRPDLDLTPYRQLIIAPIKIEYRPVAESRSTAKRSSSQYFPLTPQQKASMEQIVEEALIGEVKKTTRFTITDTEGPNVLILRTALLDVASRIPPELRSRGDVYLTSIGEATLALELRDSQTNTPMARSTDRRSAERPSSAMISNPVTSRAEARRLAQFWGRRLREELDRADEFTVNQ